MRSRGSVLLVGLGLTLAPPALHAQERVPYEGKFSLSYTFTTSTPANPIDVGGNRDLTVNSYLVTTINDSGGGLLHNVAGHCTNIRFTDRVRKTIDSRGYCNFRDRNGDRIYAEYTTDSPKPSDAITLKGKLVSGTGQYEGISGAFDATNTNNLDTEGSYQAAGKFVGAYRIVHGGSEDSFGLHE